MQSHTSSGKDQWRRLTTTFCNTAPKGSYGDGQRGSNGLRLVVSESRPGRLSRRWVQLLRIRGQRTNLGLGSYPVVTLEEARQAALENVRAARQGEDPHSPAPRGESFGDVFEQVVAIRSETWKNVAATSGAWRSQMAKYAGPLMGMPVAHIHSQDVLAVLANRSG